MAEVCVTLTCEKCGRMFVHKKETEKGNSQAYRIWAKENIKYCPDCFNKSDKSDRAEKRISGAEYRKQKRDEKEEEEEKMLEGIKLTELKGTERQVGWGTRLRREAVCMVLKEFEPNKGFISLVNAKTEAEWWIENQKELTNIYSLLVLLVMKDD